MTNSLANPNRLIVAIGGNATHPEDIEGTSQEQKTIASMTAEALLPLMMLDNELIITHGNGPVVGKILMRQMLTRDTIAPMPLDICVAHSQGALLICLCKRWKMLTTGPRKPTPRYVFANAGRSRPRRPCFR